MATPAELTAMQRAVALASAAVGVSNPNPAVGAVVLDAAGAVVGEGSTAPVGGAHAEVVALSAAGACTDAVIAAGIRRVVFAAGDPHGAAGGGADTLRAHGVDVEGGVLVDEATPDLEPWLLATRRRRPHVTWKYAASLDGRTAAADGTSRWVTGPESRADVHRLRLAADAVVVGIGTVLADDPQLTVRDHPAVRQPLRVVVDGKARVPASARVLDDSAPTLVLVGDDAEPDRVKALRSGRAEVVEISRRDGRLDLSLLLATLFDREVLRVLLEGGATLAGSFVRARLVDTVVGYHAPALLGAGPPVLADAGVSTIASALRLELQDVTRVGPDVRVTAVPAREGR
jgi:diaminohydroxyphosphoribosylaminopyrimidine deaminase/5-amino-6-(5-phosphoribosylamino)uracil reductase